MNGTLMALSLFCAGSCTGKISSGDYPGATDPAGSGAPGTARAGGATDGSGIGTTAPSDGSSTTPTTTVPTGSSAQVDPNAAGPMPLRALNRFEYDNTVADLLGDTSHPAGDFPPDERNEPAPFPVAPVVDSLRASRFADAAQALASAADLSQLAACQTNGGDEATCATQFIDEFGAKAFRRPVLDGERERLLALYQNARSAEGLDFNGGIRTVIEAMLQSGPFLYHWELGPQPAQVEGDQVRLGPYELASRLSYFLWGSMPDAELFAAAANGGLLSESDVREQALRMLSTDRARASVSTFFSQWLGVDQMPERSKDTETYPEFNDELKAAMTSELEELIQAVMLDGDGRVETLLTDNQAVVGGALATLYGLGSDAEDQHVTLDPAERSGFLTRAGFQALFGGSLGSNPVKRGVEIYRRLLCGVLPNPPPNVPPPKDASQGGTTRQRFAEHGENACAAGCHSVFDPIGFAFENYDGVGRYRTTDNGLPVDASGSITLDGQQVSFTNGLELSSLLAESTQVKQCFATQAASFGLGRSVVSEDAASIDGAVVAYETGSGGVRELLATLAASRTFRYRQPADGEMIQ